MDGGRPCGVLCRIAAALAEIGEEGKSPVPGRGRGLQGAGGEGVHGVRQDSQRSGVRCAAGLVASVGRPRRYIRHIGGAVKQSGARRREEFMQPGVWIRPRLEVRFSPADPSKAASEAPRLRWLVEGVHFTVGASRSGV